MQVLSRIVVEVCHSYMCMMVIFNDVIFCMCKFLEVLDYFHFYFFLSSHKMDEKVEMQFWLDLQKLHLIRLREIEQVISDLQKKIRINCEHEWVIDNFGPRDNGENWYHCRKCSLIK